MESYGLILKKARESKGIEVQKAARDTSISEQYITALEEEDEKVFPGEPYLYGFLKNYADYLGVNASTVTVLYKNKKIQESDTPVDMLFEHKKEVPVFTIICCIVGLLLVTGVVLFFVFSKKVQALKENNVVVDGKAEIHQYKLVESSFTKRLYKGDQITVPMEQGDVILTIAGTLNTLKIDTPSGRQQISLSEELPIDLTGDVEPDLIVYVSDVSTRDEALGAEVSMILRNGTVDSSLAFAKLDSSEDIPSIETVSATQQKKVLLSDTRAYPFSINATFRGACMFRSVVDNNEMNESYYTSGEVASMTPRNGVRLWISNGTAVRLQMIANGKTTNLDIGKAGQVVVQDIKWIRDTDGLYKVVIIEVD